MPKERNKRHRIGKEEVSLSLFVTAFSKVAEDQILHDNKQLENVIMGFRPECCSIDTLQGDKVLKESIKVEVAEIDVVKAIVK